MKSLRNLLQASKSVFIRVFCGMLIASSGVLFAESKSYEGETGTPAFQWGTIGGAAYYSHGGVLGSGSSLFKGYDELKFSLCSADIAGGAIADVNWGYGYSNWDGYAVSVGRPCSVEFKNISNLIFENNRVGSYDASLYVKAGGYISVPSKYIEESCGYGDFRCGSGGAIFANVNLSKCQNVLFRNNVAKGSGGAIYGDFTFKGDGVSQQQVLTFSHNKAIHGGGGALYTSGSNGCTITSVSKITFESNAARYGGAYVQSGARLALEACGDVLFNSNIATEYGGAVYGNNGLYFNSNSSLAFKDNYARLEGSAIYSTSGIYIQGNSNVLVKNNSSSNNDAAAIYCGSTFTISGNTNVEFQNNGFAFRTVTANISASTNANSNVKIYDSFETTTLNLNTSGAAYTSVAGTVLLSGKTSVGNVKGAATLNYGTLSLADGAVMHVGTDMKVNNKNAHITLEQGTKLEVEGSLTLSNSTYLEFSLDRNRGSATPMLLADKVTLSSSPFKLSLQKGSFEPAQPYALLEIGSSFTYKNITYSYHDDSWWKDNDIMYPETMNALFTFSDNMSYFWKNNVLYVADAQYSEDRVWVKTGQTWRGDELQPYDTKKRFLSTNYQDTSDEYKCWVLASCNAIQYWQDQYAPLYQGNYLATNCRLNSTPSADELYAFMDFNTYNKGGFGYNLMLWWLKNPYLNANNKGKNSWVTKDVNIAAPFHSGPWQHLDFYLDYIAIGTDADLGSLIKRIDNQSSPLLLEYNIYRHGNCVGAHVVTLWGADFTKDKLGNDIVGDIFITDSDDPRGLFSVEITYVNGEAYYQYDDPYNYRKISAVSAFTCTDAVDEMMKDYHDTDIALQWTGAAKDSKWVTSSTTNLEGAHLANPFDGWKKACAGGGKTIYAHAYFTQEDAPNGKFEFGNSVGGQKVTKKNVVLGQDLHVGSVRFTGSDYVLSGRQTLTADMLTITHGADLRLHGGATIGKGTVVNIDGTLRVDVGSNIDNSGIIMSASGTLWCGAITLTYAAESAKDTISLNFCNYNYSAMDFRLLNCNISNSGVLGCTLNMQDSTVSTVLCGNDLYHLVYDSLKKNNKLYGNWDDYRYEFEFQRASLNTTYDDIKKQPVALSDSSLTVDAKDNSWVTVASYTGAPDLEGTDINLSETSRTEVTAPQLVTAPEAAVLLNEQSVLNTKSFIVTANSSFRNEGTLQTLDGKGTVTVEKDATLSGSGSFSSVVSSGTLVVGSSPGAPQYESLTLNTGSTTVFYLDGTTPATSAEKGWGQGLHSVMSVSGDLVMEEGALITLGCSSDFLNGVNIGESVTLTLIRSEQSLSDSLLPFLQTGTAIRFADTDDTLTDLADYGIVVRDQTWSFNADNTQASISLNFVSGTAGAVLFQGGGETVSWSDIGTEQESGTGYTDDTPVSFYQGGHVELNSEIQPGDMVVSAKEELTWSGEGGLKGSATLLKEDEGRLVLDISSPNYEGSVIITGGVLETRRADALGAGNVSLYGATLQTPAAHLNSLEMADDVTLLGGGTASNIFLYDETSVHAEDGFTLADSGSLFLAGKADWMGDLTLSDASLVFSAGELSVTGTLTLSGDCELSLGDYAETGRYQLILCDNLSGDWESLAVSQRDDSFIYELVQEEKGLSLVVSSKEPNMYWGFAKGIWREGTRFGMGSEGEELLFSAGTHVGFNGKAQVTISGKVYPRAVTVDSPQTVTFAADKKTVGSGIAGEAVLTKSGSGVLKLNAGNTYSGGTVLNAGTIKATAADSFGTGAITVNGGTLDLASKAVVNNITVNGAAVLKGAAKYAGNELAINGDLLKGSAVTVARADQHIAIGGECSTITGTVKSAGLVEVNGALDATAAKLTAAQLKLNSGVFTNTKGIKVAKNQTLTLAGGSLNTGLKALTTAAGSTLKVEKSATLSGALTLGGGALVLEDGAELSISGTLTLSKATTLTLDGTATLTFGTLKAPKKGTLESFFGVGDDVTITQEGNTLVFNSPELTACAAPAAAEPETVAAPTPALAPAVAALAAEAVAARPLGDALVMADWAIADANRAFTGTLQSRRDSGVVLADGQGMAWVSALGGVSRHGSENGHNGADVNLSGAAVGVEHTAGANSTLGLAVGYTWSRIGATGMQHLRQDTAHVALYGQTKLPHGFTAEWSAAYGDTDSKGTFNGTRETWSQKSTAISARLNKTHDLNDSTAVRGFAGLSYDATDAASIHGMHTGSIQRLQGEVGAGITHRADKLTTYAEASVTTDLARNAPAVDFGAWRQNGATPGRTGLNLTLGAAYELTDKWSINAAYHVEAAERATQHSFNVGAGMKF